MEKTVHKREVERASAKKRLQIILEIQLNAMVELQRAAIWSDDVDLHNEYANLKCVLDKITGMETLILSSTQQP